MIGLTYRLMRDSEEGPVEKHLVLATRRRGEAGKSFRESLGDYKKAVFAKDRAAQRWRSMQARLMSLPPDGDKFMETQDLSDAAYAEMLTVDEAMYAAAEKLVRCSLAENYGAEQAEELLDFMTEQDLRGCVAMIQSGELPADFTAYPGAQPKASSTSPAGSAPVESSSSTDSQPGISKAEG